ncbi:uncharacterized protein N7529_003000 [Penicillium soppii]|uniref:uncharacterized protein n=1 Tax=Penicillium soppii TaxID=69789 RepID=UPI00254840DF|nr:uncharacterized protein N7529_003000 [Penicillium soppii]KAJ5874570.1 hypothetical protein N7529_003000 [Penicillium soppii]
MGSNEKYEYVFDETVENQRLAGQHQAFKLGMGKLVLAPLQVSQKNLRILDAGTSDGYWLDDFRPSLTHPETCELVGIDITGERFPQNPPPGVKLVVQSSMGPWPESWLQSFDLVHQRLTLFGVGTKSKDCVLELMKIVKPGGWIQLVETEHSSHEPNGPQVKRLGALIGELSAGMGSDLSFRGGAMESWIREEGFIRVGTMLAPICLGAACPDPKLREQTVQAYCFTATQLLKACKVLGFPGGLKCMSEAESESFISELAEELREKGGYFPLRIVWGQRPESV